MTARSDVARLTESAEVREEIVQALGLDLIGPWAGHPLANERLPGWVRPSNWYLTGFLVPRGMPARQRGDADVDDDLDVAESAGLGDDSVEDRKAAKKGFFPSSMGLSFWWTRLSIRWRSWSAGATTAGWRRRATARTRSGTKKPRRSPAHGRKRAADGEEERSGAVRGDGEAAGGATELDESSVRSWWQRTPREESLLVNLPATGGDPRPHPVPNSGGLTLHAVARPVNAASFAGRIAPGTRSVSLFLVNGREPSSDQERDETFAFQAEIEVRSEGAVRPAPRPPRDDRGRLG